MTWTNDPQNLIVCGIGGQGNILLSRMIGRILTGKGYRVNIGETFGAAQRGGSVYSSMRVSRNRDFGPLVPLGSGHLILSLEPLETLRMLQFYGNPDILTVTNIQPIYPVGVLSKRVEYPNLDRLLQAVKELSAGTWVLNATQIAMDFSAPIVANIVLLGALAASEALPISMEEVEAEIRASFPGAKVELNLKALRAGFQEASRN
ncbi:MAG: indolepyruvate oxidoreductase subunit beta [Deltaproteobacteria bacterium]|jgi:indolepyruvate ferredoxin oxidoreductase, beta subunit|nr:indolepyruvate oxidoreductase subunit beta [Deltaproteobacteria bacterium]